MYLGADVVAPDEDVLFVIPHATTQFSRDTRRAVFDAIGAGSIRTAGDAQKCYILCEAKDKLRVYASPISSTALARRNAEA